MKASGYHWRSQSYCFPSSGCAYVRGTASVTGKIAYSIQGLRRSFICKYTQGVYSYRERSSNVSLSYRVERRKLLPTFVEGDGGSKLITAASAAARVLQRNCGPSPSTSCDGRHSKAPMTFQSSDAEARIKPTCTLLGSQRDLRQRGPSLRLASQWKPCA